MRSTLSPKGARAEECGDRAPYKRRNSRERLRLSVGAFCIYFFGEAKPHRGEVQPWEMKEKWKSKMKGDRSRKVEKL